MNWRQRLLAAGKDRLRNAARSFGYEIIAHSHMRNHELRRDKLLLDSGVNLVIDGGANRGQYARRIRSGGYRGRIVSIEPLNVAFRELARRATSDLDWVCIQAALGEHPGQATINVAAVDQVSSLLQVTGTGEAHGWGAVSSEEVQVIPLREILEERRRAGDRVHLKLDIQGYELRALQGAEETLALCCSLEVELSTLPLYEGASTAPDLIHYLAVRGFDIFSLQPSAVDHRSGRVIELESLFVRARDQQP